MKITLDLITLLNLITSGINYLYGDINKAIYFAILSIFMLFITTNYKPNEPKE
jgi:hypothetical protein